MNDVEFIWERYKMLLEALGYFNNKNNLKL